MSMALAQDGTGFPFFAGCMYQYISGKEIKDIEVDIDEVPDYEVYQFLTKVCIFSLLVYHLNDIIGIARYVRLMMMPL